MAIISSLSLSGLPWHISEGAHLCTAVVVVDAGDEFPTAPAGLSFLSLVAAVLREYVVYFAYVACSLGRPRDGSYRRFCVWVGPDVM